VEDLEKMRLSTEEIDQLLGEKPSIELLAARTRILATPYGEARVRSAGTLGKPEEAALTQAIEALEKVAAGVNKRQRERIAAFRRYLENLPRQSAECEAKRQGKRIGSKAFAALVGVSPKTLLDWHTSGVFEPAYIDPKGWRFYTFEQVAEAKALLRKRRR
jgi:DNA-binding transcriptional MerR regulator